MAKHMNRGLVALSSAAILSVYGVGYVLSQPAEVSLAAGTAQTPTTGSAAPASPQGLVRSDSASSSTASVAPAATASAASPSSLAASTATSVPSPTAVASAATSGLKDGTYSGSGTSRHGGVTVNVTIKNGRITAAPITGVTTRYSVNVITGLPVEVVSAQSANINLVSGATDSSSAYVQAVQQALAKAGGSSSSTSGGTVQVTGPQGVIYSSAGQNG